jgi:hypothetical protein
VVVCGLGRREVLYELACCEGWAWYAWAVENDAWRESERLSAGYVRQEIEARLKWKSRKQKTESRKRAGKKRKR